MITFLWRVLLLIAVGLGLTIAGAVYGVRASENAKTSADLVSGVNDSIVVGSATRAVMMRQTYSRVSLCDGWLVVQGKPGGDTVTVWGGDVFGVDQVTLLVRNEPVVTTLPDGTWSIAFKTKP